MIIITDTPNCFKGQQSRKSEVEAYMMSFNSSNKKWIFLSIYIFFFNPGKTLQVFQYESGEHRHFAHIENKVW